jgi:hypothetical protein
MLPQFRLSFDAISQNSSAAEQVIGMAEGRGRNSRKPRATHDRLIQRGKWSRSDVPHSDWVWAGVEDLGEPSQICEMCEFQHIRYVHRMRHSDYAFELRVGADCAGFMSGDHDAAESRDREMRYRATRLRAFMTRGWTSLGDGRSLRALQSVEVTVGPHPQLGWQATVRDVKARRDRTSKRRYSSEQDVKLAAFGVVEEMLAHRGNTRWRSTATAERSPRPARPSQRSASESAEERSRREVELTLGYRIVKGKLRRID